jgi:Permuted papain-like amidase enzyme, YaeF/YiiX, C92 family
MRQDMRIPVLLFACYMAFTVTACNNGDNTNTSGNNPAPQNLKDKIAIQLKERLADGLLQIEDAKKYLQKGDMVVRMGGDYTSRNVVAYSAKDKRYSHCGFILEDGGQLYVYHIIPEERTGDDHIHRELLDSFANPNNNVRFGIYRFNLDAAEITKLDTIVKKYVAQGVRFDRQFDLETDDMLYCAEMTLKSIERATNKRINFKTLEFTTGEKQKYIYVPMDYLYLHPECKMIRDYAYMKDPIGRPDQ